MGLDALALETRQCRPSRDRAAPAIRRSRSIPAVALLLLAALLVIPATAYPVDASFLHPNLVPGAGAGKRFDTQAPAAVNLFNGNLLLTLPLGLRYPVSPALGYQTVLYYNSSIWTFDASGEATPSPFFNAGVGFDVSLGRLLEPASTGNPTSHWLYVSPDGAPHPFYSTLHAGIADVDDPTDAVLYTRDSSYLRLRQVATDLIRIDRGDGTYDDFAPVQGEWRLVQLGQNGDTDAASISYSVDDSQWTITDSHGRSHTITFTTDPTGTYPRLVQSIDLAAFDGARSVWQLSYTTATVARACADPRGGTQEIPLLQSITEPEGFVRTFEYYGATASCESAGRLERAQLPTGGFFSWTYGDYQFPPQECGTPGPAYLTSVAGVTSSSKVTPNGNVLGTWTYDPVLTSQGYFCPTWTRSTEISTPRGDRIVHHFAVDNGSDAPLYGLPVEPASADATGTRFLSRETFDCASDGTGCVLLRSEYERYEQDTQCSSLLDGCWDTNRRRSSWRTLYHDDPTSTGEDRVLDVDLDDFDGVGHYRDRVTSANFDTPETVRRTVDYNPGQGTYVPGTGGSFAMVPTTQYWMLDDYSYREAESSAGRVRTDHCFDGWGRELRRRLRLDPDQLSSHDVVVAYTWDGRKLVEEARLGGDLQSVSTGALCNLTLPAPEYRERHEYQSGVESARYSLDAGGAPMSFRSLDRTIDSSTGLVATERDVAGIATDLTYDRQARLTWRKPEAGQGAWVQSVYYPPTGGSSWADGPRTRIYRRPNGWGAAMDTEKRWQDVFGNDTGDELSLPDGQRSRRVTLYGAFGEVLQSSERFIPNGPIPTAWTVYAKYDPFGRPLRVRPATGADDDVVFAYLGDRETIKTSQGATWYFGQSNGTCLDDDVVQTTVRDLLGRVVLERLERAKPLPSTVTETETDYDASGRVIRQDSLRTVGSTTTNGWTSFEYDGRGFLERRYQADQDAVVVDMQTFDDLDSDGHPHRTTRRGYSLPYPGIETVSSYDAAGRLVSVVDAADPSKKWKELVYGTDNAAGDQRLGRLVTSRRYNYANAYIMVEDQYRYGGIGGRQSEHDLTLCRIGATSCDTVFAAYRQGQTYDELGRVVELDYPVCTTCGTGESPAERTVTYGYGQGVTPLPTSIASTGAASSHAWVTAADYSAAMQPTRLVHANGVVDTYELDPIGLPRYRSIETAGTYVDQTFGPIAYDGRGDMCGVGDRSAVDVPVEMAAASFWQMPCLPHYDMDPFARFTGDIDDPSCSGDLTPPDFVYDAQDQRVAIYDRRATKRVFLGGTWYVASDPDGWFRDLLMRSPDGRVLSKIEHNGIHFDEWSETLDTIYGPQGEALGKELSQPSLGTQWQHLHETGLATNVQGVAVNPYE